MGKLSSTSSTTSSSNPSNGGKFVPMLEPSTSSQGSICIPKFLKRIETNMRYFNRLFEEVASCSNFSLSPTPHEQEQLKNITEIPSHSFTPAQRNAVVQFSGHLQAMHDEVYELHLKNLHERSIFRDWPIHLPSRVVDGNITDPVGVEDINGIVEKPTEFGCEEDDDKLPVIVTTEPAELSDEIPALIDEKSMDLELSIEQLHQKIFLLQDYLVNELNRSEKLEETLKQVETDRLKLIEERNKLRKQSIAKVEIKGEQAPKPSEPVGNSSAVEDHDYSKPSTLINQYVRKSFGGRLYFGIVASYRHPFFMVRIVSIECLLIEDILWQVVYEDGDKEEISKSELQRIHWIDPVPSSRVAMCDRHRKRLESSENNQKVAASSSQASNKSKKSNIGPSTGLQHRLLEVESGKVNKVEEEVLPFRASKRIRTENKRLKYFQDDVDDAYESQRSYFQSKSSPFFARPIPQSRFVDLAGDDDCSIIISSPLKPSALKSDHARLLPSQLENVLEEILL